MLGKLVEQQVHVDLYLNGTGEALSSCAYRLTMEKTEIIVDPPRGLPTTSKSACEGGLNPPSATDQTLADNHSAFCSGEKGNQCSVNAALSDPLFLATQNLSAEERRDALDALSGEVHATVSSVLLDASRYVRDAVLGRLKQAYYSRGQADEVAPAGSAISHSDTWGLGPMPGGRSEPAPPDNSRLTFWTRAYRAWGKFDGDQDAASADSVLGGFLSGVDAPVSGSWRLGLATGFSQSDIDVDARHSTAAVDSTHLAAYTSGEVGAFALRGGGAWAWNDIETSRSVVFPGFFEREEAHYGADTGQVFGEVAYPVTMGEIALEPFAGLAFASVMSDGLKERGGIAALRSSGDDQDVSYSTLGLRAATTVNWNRVALTPHISAAWQHAFDEPAATTLAFASSGLGFDVTGVPLAENSLLVEAGLDLNVSSAITLGVSYSGQLASEVQDNAIKGRFSWRF